MRAPVIDSARERRINIALPAQRRSTDFQRELSEY
uniref:Uncharacterized protein n=1 Tax=Anguilla anguilla TaxID=7936 RepID=A0A0E9PW77_ANGAN